MTITRTVTRDTLARWGIPYPSVSDTQAEVLDIVELGGEGFADYKQMIFTAPDDGNVYSVDFARGLAIAEPFMGQPAEITITRVRSEKRVVTVTDWLPVTEEYLAGPIPTLAKLKAQWDRNRKDDLAAAEDATW